MNSIKEKAAHFLKLISETKIEEAFELYVSKNFIHHNPYFKADAQSLQKAMKEDAKANPEKELKILRSLEDEDLVAVHSYVKQYPDDNGFVLVHFFKFSEDRIIELWDLGQKIPDQSINEIGML
ncbi:nuclear transport factor 2 family protein [Marivirga salinae]|uniref:Nuclear transport factor 2 family protein n=1 Tax=Marivirga salinarum TaxID=3059078 RepID=A0AA51NC33_9BACT|nr:nuclear transport factor 2 family protein [Marivirga sp. BDSF4-3]WMN12219.1 nuclear transport factor 2 family protein [Marivirga sp. BDSF4-3]